LPGGKHSIQQKLTELGPISLPEKKVLTIFSLVALGWILRGLLEFEALSSISDASIAIAGAVLLFIIPAEKNFTQPLLDWHTAKTIPWDIMILFGGGFALANGFSSSGLTEWLANQLVSLQGMELIFIVLMVVLLVIFLTEITSNTATASLMLPVMGAFAIAIQISPLYLMVAAALAASFAFMLPVATPPNAIVFSSRKISIPEMAKAGVWLNIVGSIVITLFVIFYLPSVFDL
jgi:sodium-dependent dicarboxylate transporter 2/3/5